MSLKNPGSVADTSRISPSLRVLNLSATCIIGPGQERPQALSLMISPAGDATFPAMYLQPPNLKMLLVPEVEVCHFAYTCFYKW